MDYYTNIPALSNYIIMCFCNVWIMLCFTLWTLFEFQSRLCITDTLTVNNLHTNNHFSAIKMNQKLVKVRKIGLKFRGIICRVVFSVGFRANGQFIFLQQESTTRCVGSATRVQHARLVHQEVVRILLVARESLLNDFTELAKLLPSWQQRALEIAQNTHKEITKVCK